MKNPFRREKALTGTPAVLEALNSRQWSPYAPLGGTNLRADRINGVYVTHQNAAYGWMYRMTPGVRRVVEYLAGNVSQLGCKLYERVDEDDRQPAGDHVAARGLRRPNPWTGGRKFIRTLVTDYLTYENAYALKLRAQNDGPLTYVNLSPAIVGIIGQSHFQIEGYQILLRDGSKLNVSPSDMFHWRGENPDDPRRGESRLETLREEIAADAAARQAVTEVYRSGLSLPGWLERPLEAPVIGDDSLRRLRESTANQMKAGRREVPVFEEGMVFKQGSLTPEDAELLGARRWTNEQIASLYGMKNIPPEGDEERRQFYTDVLPDICGQLAEAFTLHIAYHEYGLEDYYFEFNLDDKLMGDERIKSLVSAAGAPIFTVNEARAKANLPAKPGGDKLIVPMNVTQGGKPSPGVMPPQDPNKPSQDGDHRSGDADEPAAAGSRSLNGHSKELVPVVKRVLHPRREAQRQRIFYGYKGDLQDVVRGFISHFERSLKSKQMDAKAVEDTRWERRLAKELRPVAQGIVEAEGAKAAQRVLGSFDFERTREYVEAATFAKAEEIVQALRRHLAEGDPSEVFAQARENAAPQAAATMAGTYANFAVKEVAEQNEKTVTWIVTSQNSAHPELNGETVRAGETFSNGQFGPPADHPGCQCMLEIGSEKTVEPQTQALDVLAKSLERLERASARREDSILALAKAIAEQKPANITVEPSQTHFHENAFPIQNNVTTPELKMEKGAIEVNNPVHVESPPPADIRFDKGAFAINSHPPDVRFEEGAMKNEIVVEASKPADVNFHEGAFKVEPAKVDVHPPNVTVEAPKTGKKTVTFSDGSIAAIEESPSDEHEG